MSYSQFYQIVYFSTLRPGMDPEEEINNILQVARERNELLGVTGMLIYNGGSFLQVLEGDRAVITKLYGKICKDQRHYNINTVVAIADGERLFKDWTMGYKNTDKLDKDHADLKPLIEGVIQKSLNHEKVDYNEVKLLLRRFRFND